MIFIGSQLFASWRKEEKEKANAKVVEDFAENYESRLVDAQGNEYKYTICNKNMGRVFAVVVAFLGMISVGLAELQGLPPDCPLPGSLAGGNCHFDLCGGCDCIDCLGWPLLSFAFGAGPEVLGQVVSVIIFTAPGVIIGGQLGPALQTKLNPDIIKVGVAILFIIVGLVMLTTLA